MLQCDMKLIVVANTSESGRNRVLIRKLYFSVELDSKYSNLFAQTNIIKLLTFFLCPLSLVLMLGQCVTLFIPVFRFG